MKQNSASTRILRISLLISTIISASVQAIPNQPECADEDCSLAKLNTLRALASRGHEQTSFSLGHIFMNPESGVKTDLENAYYYFDKSAKQGFLPAYRQAAGMAAQGIGTQKNMAEAKRLMKFAADEGVNRTAEEYAVLVFSDNESTDEEKATAVEFLEAEVEEGMSYLANYVLAVLYINGEFVEKDIVKAKSLLAFPASGKYANSVELLQQLSGEKVIAQDNENPKSTAGLDSSIETITVTGISINMGDVHGLMLSELRKHHGQTGSRIKGNGCKRGDPQCVILDSGSIRTPTFWQVGTTR